MAKPSEVVHGQRELPLLTVQSYSLPLKDGSKFIGDRASGTEFREILSRHRGLASAFGPKPFGSEKTVDIDSKKLDGALAKDRTNPEKRTIERSVEEFAEQFTSVLLRFLQTPEWSGTERVVCGGGLSQGDVGEEVFGRVETLLRGSYPSIEVKRLHHHPDEAGMIGWAFVAPAYVLAQGNGFLAIDIGGTNLRWGIVRVNGPTDDAGSYSVVCKDKWCHAEDNVSRDDVVERMALELRRAADAAGSRGVTLAPFIGLSCPGLVSPDGRILRGVQNLPGDWSDDDFLFPDRIADQVGMIGGAVPTVLLHNDAVIQALSDAPLMVGVERWAAVTLGTGLGNCSFANRTVRPCP